jgi:hypothetical protein
MNVDACTSLPITTAMSRLDLGIGVCLPGPLRRAGLPRPEPAANGTARGLRAYARVRPKDLGTLDGSRGGLILPRRVKGTLHSDRQWH